MTQHRTFGNQLLSPPLLLQKDECSSLTLCLLSRGETAKGCRLFLFSMQTQLPCEAGVASLTQRVEQTCSCYTPGLAQVPRAGLGPGKSLAPDIFPIYVVVFRLSYFTRQRVFCVTTQDSELELNKQDL